VHEVVAVEVNDEPAQANGGEPDATNLPTTCPNRRSGKFSANSP
jgi:hypothetical protein